MNVGTSSETVFDCLIERGLSPEVIVDVGVATGTPHLYRRFPSAFYYLVEPLSVWKPSIAQHLKTLNGVHHAFAAGETEGTTKIIIPKGAKPGGANLVYDYKSEEIESEEEIGIKRLDGLISPKEIGKDAILKTDCQGFDANAILGADKILEFFAVIQVETVFNLPSGTKTVFEIVPYLNEKGFQLLAIVDPTHNNAGNQTQVDFIFVNKICANLFRSN